MLLRQSVSTGFCLQSLEQSSTNSIREKKKKEEKKRTLKENISKIFLLKVFLLLKRS